VSSSLGEAAEGDTPARTDTGAASSELLSRLTLDIHRYRLRSGLSVVLNPDRSANTVAICMSFPNRVLATSPEISERARLLQELRAENLDVAPEIARELAWRGLFEARELAWDFVSFCRVSPANDLEFAIWAMARQSGDLPSRILPMPEHGREAESVRETHARTIDWFLGRAATSAKSPPLRVEALEAPEFERLRVLARGFWDTGRAVLSLSGDLDGEQARGFVAEHFELGVPATLAPSSLPHTGNALELRSGQVTWPLPRSAVFLAFEIPAVDDPDHAALRLFARLLSSDALGQGRAGARDAMRALTAESAGSDILTVELSVERASEASRARQRLLAKLAEIARHPPRRDAVSRALELERSAFWMRFETPVRRAMTLGESEARRGDARHALRDLERLERVRPLDVSRVVEKYLLPAKPAVLVATSEGAR
jgi:predicted Zn-dependent peptidase